MKDLIKIYGLLVLSCLFSSSCKEPVVEAGFEDQEKLTIYDYITENKDNYSSFLSILEKGGIDKTLTAYNPNGIGYTLFLPTNSAVDEFIAQNPQYNTLQDLLADETYVRVLCRYHIVNMGIESNSFPFGALPEYTLSEDFLTVGFVIEQDTSYYKINNEAPVIQPNIELSNGYIHVISNMLKPVVYTTYNWLELNPGYSIFKAAVDTTGLKEVFDLNMKEVEDIAFRPFTLLVEHDSVFNKRGIASIQDLINLVSPDRTDYASNLNPLYGFVSYHQLTETMFMDDFVDNNTNYTTYSAVPLNIDGLGLDIAINKGKEIFDTIINTPDTTIINYISFDYDASNVLTQSGVIHFIDRVMFQKTPSRANQVFEFYNEPLFNEYRLEPGEYLVEDPTALQVVKWTGPDLIFVETGNNESPAWSADYLYLNGDFTISYTIPKIVQGNYTVLLYADAFYYLNALIEVYIDGKKVGGLVDLTTGGSSSNPFFEFEIGSVNFLKYEAHTVEIRSRIPGIFIWDYIRFEPL
ncbi:MAG: fasciclin domain-containing protein [Bacteroidales bacterium]|nr:fasciclin domain-containing protein [Bacteroidales bacterium]